MFHLISNRHDIWNYTLPLKDEVWRELKKRSEEDKPVPAYEKVIDGKNYCLRWKKILHKAVYGELLFWPELKKGVTCKACNSNDHETHKCLFLHYALNCHHIRETKRNILNKDDI